MSSCVNPNNKEFQEILKRINNPLLAELEYDRQENVKYFLKSVDALFSEKAKQLFTILSKNRVQGETFWKKLQSDLSIPKEQIEILKSFNTYDREELLTNLLANYSYAVEINTAKDKIGSDYYGKASVPKQIIDRDGESVTGGKIGQYWVEFINDDGDPDVRVFDTFEEANKAVETQQGINNSTVYSNLTVPGGTNYTENEISTPLITPSIKGHAQFATSNGIGWFRSDDKHPFTGFLEDLIASGTIKKVPC